MSLREFLSTTLVFAASVAFIGSLLWTAPPAKSQLAPTSVYLSGWIETPGISEVWVRNVSLGSDKPFDRRPFKRFSPQDPHVVVRVSCEAVDCSIYEEGDTFLAIVRGRSPGGLAEFVAWSLSP